MPGGKRPGAGRPKGSKNKVTEQARARLADLAQEYTEEALETLVAVMRDSDAPHAARVNAATSMLDRGHGKPIQAAEVSGNIGVNVNMPDDELNRQIVEKLMAKGLSADAIRQMGYEVPEDGGGEG